MKSVSVVVMSAVLLTGCGYSSVDNEAIGQPKKVHRETPLVCPDYRDVDISLGVVRNGVGSMSTQDAWFTVENDSDAIILDQAVKDGKLVRVVYNELRVAFCVPEYQIRKVEIIP